MLATYIALCGCALWHIHGPHILQHSVRLFVALVFVRQLIQIFRLLSIHMGNSSRRFWEKFSADSYRQQRKTKSDIHRTSDLSLIVKRTRVFIQIYYLVQAVSSITNFDTLKTCEKKTSPTKKVNNNLKNYSYFCLQPHTHPIYWYYKVVFLQRACRKENNFELLIIIFIIEVVKHKQ